MSHAHDALVERDGLASYARHGCEGGNSELAVDVYAPRVHRVLVIATLVVGCSSGKSTAIAPAPRPRLADRDENGHSRHAHPRPDQIVDAPGCARFVVDARARYAAWRPTSEQPSFALVPEPPAEWRRKMASPGFGKLLDLGLPWDAPLGCIIRVDVDEASREQLSRVNFRTGTDLGKILTGTVPLVYAACLPDLPFVAKVDCGSGHYTPENQSENK